jgi:hypothetical protein
MWCWMPIPNAPCFRPNHHGRLISHWLPERNRLASFSSWACFIFAEIGISRRRVY